MGRTSAKVVIFPQNECDGECEKDVANRVSTAYRLGSRKKSITDREERRTSRLFLDYSTAGLGKFAEGGMDAIDHCHWVLHQGH